LAIWHAVLAQIARQQIVRRDPEISGRRGASSSSTPRNPGGHRVALPAPFPRSRRPVATPRLTRGVATLRGEVQQARLHAVVSIDAKRVVVLPGNAQVRWQVHESRRAVRLALIAGRFVFRLIPRIGGFLAGRRDRNADVVTFRWWHHTQTPVLSDERRPVTRRIKRSGSS